MDRAAAVLFAILGLSLPIAGSGCNGTVSTLTPEPTPTPWVVYVTTTPSPTLVSTYTAAPIPTATAAPQASNTPVLTPTPKRTEVKGARVIDGDTISVSIDGVTYNVRYIGIDAPEPVHPQKPVEWMGPEATEANKRLVEGKTIYLEKDVSETDQYGRLLRYAFLADGTFVNAELVRLGYAQVSTYPPDVKYQELFLQMQREAREAGQGLWGPTPVAQPTPTTRPTQPSMPTATPQPAAIQPPAAGMGNVVISFIFYDGVVPRVESDEYAQITNKGTGPVNLKGWHLNAGDPGQDFWFPDFVLGPGQSCRVYTNEHHPESGGFSFGSGKAIWNNKGDCGYLYDAAGAVASKYCY